MQADPTGFYQDIRCLPNPEIAPNAVMEVLFGAVHKALTQEAAPEVGLSFPEHNSVRATLGACLRVHGPRVALERLAASGWLTRVQDYVQCGPIGPVPQGCQHRVVKRVQAKSSPARLRRRAMRRHGLDTQAALATIPDTAAERLRLPFVIISSASTGQHRFPLFIRHEPVQPTPQPGPFSAYGLSLGGSVPWF